MRSGFMGIAILAVSTILLAGCAQPRTDGPIADRPSFNGCIPVPAGGQLFINSVTIDPADAEGGQEMTIDVVRDSQRREGVIEVTPVLASADDFIPGFLVPSGDPFFEGLEFTRFPASFTPEDGIVSVGVLVQFADDVSADGSEPVIVTDGIEYTIEDLGTFVLESRRSVWLTREPVESDEFCAAFHQAIE